MYHILSQWENPNLFYGIFHICLKLQLKTEEIKHWRKDHEKLISTHSKAHSENCVQTQQSAECRTEASARAKSQSQTIRNRVYKGRGKINIVGKLPGDILVMEE